MSDVDLPKFDDLPKDFRQRFARFAGYTERKIPDNQDNLTLEELRPYLRTPQSSSMWMTPLAQSEALPGVYVPGQAPPAAEARDDLRHLRPYYLVPLLELSEPGEHETLRKEILQDAAARRSEGSNVPPVTDLFVISHGWHRNWFSGVSAYDRLLSRFFLLTHRRRIEANTPPFSPLFICFHWHSDPGQDLWVDGAGRRDKAGFLKNCSDLFEPVVPDGIGVQNDFEDLFEVMAYISAPDVSVNRNAISPNAQEFTAIIQERTTKLTRNYQIKDVGRVSPAEMVTHLWRCYDEADAHGLRVDQYQQPVAFGSPATALGTLASLLVGAGVLSLALVPKVLPAVAHCFQEHRWFEDQLWMPTVHKVLSPLSVPGYTDWIDKVPGQWIFGLLLAYALSTGALGAMALWKRYLGHVGRWRRDMTGKTNAAAGLPFLVALFWAVAQVIGLVPILSLLFITWFARSWVAILSVPCFLVGRNELFFFPGEGWMYGAGILTLCLALSTILSATGAQVRGLFSERLRNRGDEPFNARDYLAAIARLPINLLRLVVGRDSSLFQIAQLLDNQLGFFELQRKGVDSGDDAGRFLSLLLNRDPELAKARVHFVGHSFGGLVILNAARRLFTSFGTRVRLGGPKKHKSIRDVKRKYDSGIEKPIESGGTSSMALLESATASSWFRDEGDLVRAFKTIGCVYSKYDTANGFYYPCANNGRLASGWVGLCDMPDGVPSVVGHGGELAMVIKPPALPEPSPAGLNMDASRLIYEGAVLSGGGHDDIFKDDVVNLVWAISQR